MSLKDGYLVGIDSGTQNVRVAIFDAQGHPVSQGSTPHRPPQGSRPGHAEQDPQDLWEGLCQASQEAVAGFSAPLSRLKGAAVAAQKAVLIAVDTGGHALRPAFSWMDTRQTQDAPAIPNLTAELQAARRSSKAAWMQAHEPALYRRTHRFLTAGGWLVHRLTGEFSDSSGMQVNESPFDVQKLDWHGDEHIHAAHAMPLDKLVKLKPPGALLGHVSAKAAEQCGLPAGLPVYAGAGDKVCEALGAGAVHPGQVSVSFGTLACAVVTVSSFIRSAQGQYWTNPGALPGAWSLEADIPGGFWLARWFCEQFAADLKEEAGQNGLAVEHLLSQQAAVIPPGAEGLVWTPQERGLALGFQPHHTRAHLFRALLEGIGFELRAGIELLTRDSGTRPEEVIAGGGGAQSDLMLQITADVLNLPVRRPRTVQIGALGAAIAAAAGAGVHPGFEAAAAAMAHSDRTFEPNNGSVRIYDKLYRDVYLPLQPALRPVLENLPGRETNNTII